MSRLSSCLVGSRLLGFALVAAALAAFVFASPASAGLGDLVKKAKEKATKVVAPAEETPGASNKPCPPPEFDAVTVELNEARVQGILATFKAAGDAGAGRPPLVDTLTRIQEEKSAIYDKHWEKMQAARDKRSEIETCYHDGYREAGDRRAKEYAQRAMGSDPKLIAKFSKLAQQNNAAAAQGDSAAQARLQQGMQEEYLPTKEDSAAVRKSCGPIPPRSAEEARYEALEKREREYNDKIGKIDEKVWKAQAKYGGMDGSQWSAALERIRGYVGHDRKGKNAKTAICGFTKTELEALDAHQEELRAVLGG